MHRRDIARVERELLELSRNPGMGAFADPAAQPDHLDRGVYLLLSRLDESGPMSIKDLAQVFRLATSTINRSTAAMMRRGLVERIPDPDGGIARKLRISQDASERLNRHRAWVELGLSHVLADWTQAESDALASSLEHLNANVERLRDSHDPVRQD